MNKKVTLSLICGFVFVVSPIFLFYIYNSETKKAIKLFEEKKYAEAFDKFYFLNSLASAFTNKHREYLLSIYVNQGKYTKSGPMASSILKNDPQNVFALRSLALSLMGSKKFEDALSVLEHGITLQEDSDQIESLGMLAFQMIRNEKDGDYLIQWSLRQLNFLKSSKLIEEILKQIEISKKNTRGYLEIEINLRKALFSLSPKDAANLITLARLYKLKDDLENVIFYYQQGIKINPDKAAYLEEFADLLLERKINLQQASEYYQKSLNITPGNLDDIRERIKKKIKKVNSLHGNK